MFVTPNLLSVCDPQGVRRNTYSRNLRKDLLTEGEVEMSRGVGAVQRYAMMFLFVANSGHDSVRVATIALAREWGVPYDQADDFVWEFRRGRQSAESPAIASAMRRAVHGLERRGYVQYVTPRRVRLTEFGLDHALELIYD